MAEELLRQLGRYWAAVKAIAQTGLAFTQENPFERERYEALLKIAARMVAALEGSEGISEGALWAFKEAWLKEVKEGSAGYVTPKVVVNAAIFDERERLLLIQRADKGTWFLPGGWADVGYTPAEIAVKETEEETGLKVTPLRLLAILDSFQHEFSTTLAFYSLIFECRIEGGTLRPLPHECQKAGFFPPEALPSPLHGDGRWVTIVFAAHRGEIPAPYFD